MSMQGHLAAQNMKTYIHINQIKAWLPPVIEVVIVVTTYRKISKCVMLLGPIFTVSVSVSLFTWDLWFADFTFFIWLSLFPVSFIPQLFLSIYKSCWQFLTTVICLSFKPELTFDQGPGYAVCSLNKKMATSHALPVGVEHSSKNAAMQQIKKYSITFRQKNIQKVWKQIPLTANGIWGIGSSGICLQSASHHWD